MRLLNLFEWIAMQISDQVVLVMDWMDYSHYFQILIVELVIQS